jgi:hypothetical protein
MVVHGFSVDDYDAVVSEWAEYKSRIKNGEIDDIPDPKNPCH